MSNIFGWDLPPGVSTRDIDEHFADDDLYAGTAASEDIAPHECMGPNSSSFEDEEEFLPDEEPEGEYREMPPIDAHKYDYLHAEDFVGKRSQGLEVNHDFVYIAGCTCEACRATNVVMAFIGDDKDGDEIMHLLAVIVGVCELYLDKEDVNGN